MSNVKVFMLMAAMTAIFVAIGGALGGSGDPSPMTAWGVYVGMKASTQWTYGTKDLSQFRVAIQGLGHTGYWLASYLHKDGVKMYVTDIDEDRVNRVVQEFNAEAVAPDDIYGVDAEIFSPAALGGIVVFAAVRLVDLDGLRRGADRAPRAPGARGG